MLAGMFQQSEDIKNNQLKGQESFIEKKKMIKTKAYPQPLMLNDNESLLREL